MSRDNHQVPFMRELLELESLELLVFRFGAMDYTSLFGQVIYFMWLEPRLKWLYAHVSCLRLVKNGHSRPLFIVPKVVLRKRVT